MPSYHWSKSLSAGLYFIMEKFMMEKFRKFASLTLAAMVAVISMFVGLIGVVPVAPAHAQLNLPRIPWEGGPAYWAQFPQAAASGWTDPNFFPISVFLPN